MGIHHFKRGLRLDSLEGDFPSRMICCESEELKLAANSSHYFGFALEGASEIKPAGLPAFPLAEHMYFSSPAPLLLKAGGKVVVWERIGYKGMFLVGGPTETHGRLSYIDHCTTTMLAPPPRVPDPVLNFLYFPPDINQTPHYHPTVRLGVVFGGSGFCVRPGQSDQALGPGTVFRLEEKVVHSFRSGPGGLSLIAYHPESDTGPTDESHPMLNRTYRIKG
jgi:hypothetical protein